MVHDPYYDLVPEPEEPGFDPERTALLVIDLQYLDAHPDGWMGRLAQMQGRPGILQERWEGIEEMLPRVRRLQDACRAGGVEVMHIRIAYRTRDCRDGQRSIAAPEVSAHANDRDYEFLEEVAPKGDEVIIDKTSAGAFNSTAIDQVLRNMGIDRLWVAGIVTDGCVEMTARDAADRGYYVTLVRDGCSASTRLAHADALHRMADGGLIKVRRAEELVDRIRAATR